MGKSSFDFKKSVGRLWEAAKAAERKILLMQEISEEVIQQVLTADADDGTVNADNGAFVDTDARDQR